MWRRILIAGLVGGVLVFFTGAFNHMVLGLQGRTLTNVPDSGTFVEQLKLIGRESRRREITWIFWSNTFRELTKSSESARPTRRNMTAQSYAGCEGARA